MDTFNRQVTVPVYFTYYQSEILCFIVLMNFYNIEIVLKSIQESSKEKENQQTSLIFIIVSRLSKPVFFTQ